MSVADRYVSAVNAADEAALMALFATGAVLRHPLGTFSGHAEMSAFYRDVVFAGGARTEITRRVDGPGVEIAQIEAVGPDGDRGRRAHAVDVFVLGGDGLVTELEIYYR